MRCPKCSDLDDKVVDSRLVKNGEVIRRRRLCLKCSYRFTTYEEVQKSTMKVLKKDGRHEDLSRSKLLHGVQVACEKRPISVEQIESLVDSIMTELEAEHDREVPSAAIGKKVMERLQKIDEVAYVRFASVYRQFRDIHQFLSEVEGLMGKEQ